MSRLAHQNGPDDQRCSRTRLVLICQFASLPVCAFLLSGCLERTVTITSTPSDAIVWLKDVVVGRTSVKTGFTFYGDYCVRIRKEGYEPISTHRETDTPFYEYAPIDLAATAWPGRIKTNLVWHFDLTPSPDPKAEEPGLMRRAREMRDSVGVPTN